MYWTNASKRERLLCISSFVAFLNMTETFTFFHQQMAVFDSISSLMSAATKHKTIFDF